LERLAGLVFLQLEGKTYGIFGFQCYIKPLGDERFVVWHHIGTDKNRTGLRVALYDARTLRAIPKPNVAAAAVRSSSSLLLEADPIASLAIPASLPDGQNRIAIPEALTEIDELLMYGNSTTNGRTSNGWDKSNVTLVRLLPSERSVYIYWQRWFNEGPFDFVWQGPDKVAREPKSGKVVGHGVRLGIFEYDDSLQEVSWIQEIHAGS